MLSTCERTASGIIYKPAENREFPKLDLLTLLFESDISGANEDTVLHADAADPTKAITRAQLRPLVKRTAYTFRHQYGIGRDGPNQDAVLAICTGHWLLPNLFYSTIAAGGVYSASNPGSTPKELAAQLAQISARLLFCTEDTKFTAIAAAKLVNLPLSRVLCLNPTSRTFQLTEQEHSRPIPLSASELSWQRITSLDALSESIICIPFSSGTTGVAKACRISHTNMVSQCTLVVDLTREYYARQGRPFVFRNVAHLPPAHTSSIQGYFINTFYAGGTVYWMPRFDFAQFLAHARRHRLTHFFTVPPVYLLIAKSPAVTDQFDHVEQAISGASPMGKELQAAARAKLGRGTAQLSQTWGMTETAGAMTFMPLGEPNDETGSVSSLMAGTMARIVDDEGRDVEPGEMGEIWVKGPQVMKGYVGNEQANRESFVDGWFCTGDVAIFKGGLFYILDRKKELIKCEGTQVAPSELEALLISHPKILDAAVIGVHVEGDEVPRAYVVADEKQITSQDIVDWVSGQVASHKRLRGGVIFLPSIPRTGSGKTMKNELRAFAQESAGESEI
ncbi:putative acyl-coenzyme A synthetase [Madurella mycetomatis]|uniref:Acyl-coenzyme A synthetase n=1 Tax=Madurella mycetomatis TaxID=100816 RepID=A0A175VX38_9PEZI|nr:putative acyl-coenzyme A synthetase [Madurella mycetomatis]